MKKLLIGLAAVGLSTAVFADVTSQNIVGYDKEDWMTKGDYFMMGSQFEKVDGTELTLGDIKIDMDIEDVPLCAKSNPEFYLTAVQIQVSYKDQGGTQGPYYYAKTGADGSGLGWYNKNGKSYSSTVIAPGMGFWFMDPAGDTPNFTISGGVVSDPTVTKTFGANDWRMLVNPYPVAVNLSDITFEGIDDDVPVCDKDGKFMDTASCIQMPSDKVGGFSPIYYYASMKGVNGWYNKNGKALDLTTIPLGRGAWFKANKTMNITFSFAK